MKTWKQNLKNMVPLDYIVFIDVPMKSSAKGDFIDLKPEVLDFLAAKAILQNKIPLRGKEVNFLRKVLGLSLEKFANKLDLSSGTVFHWEKSENTRLSLVNEVAVRVFTAEQLNIEISPKFSDLVGVNVRELKVSAAS
ncbi:MAG: helix-turn-helix domain-containing protein [Pseudobdellovibrio sp.]